MYNLLWSSNWYVLRAATRAGTYLVFFKLSLVFWLVPHILYMCLSVLSHFFMNIINLKLTAKNQEWLKQDSNRALDGGKFVQTNFVCTNLYFYYSSKIYTLNT